MDIDIRDKVKEIEEPNKKKENQNRSALKKLIERYQLLDEAVEASDKKLYDDAISKYKDALKLDETDYETLHNIGYCYAKQKQFDKALEYFNKALAIKKNILTLHSIALVYVHEKKYEEALEYCDKALELSPDFRECLNDKYIIYMELKKYEKALDVMEKIINLYPVNISEYYNLTEAYIFNDKFDKAVITLERYINNQINPFIYLDDFEKWKEKIEKSNSPQKDELLNLLNKLSLRQREDYV